MKTADIERLARARDAAFEKSVISLQAKIQARDAARAARGVLSERDVADLEGPVFGAELLRKAYLQRDAAALAFCRAVRARLAKAETTEEAGRIAAKARAEAPGYLSWSSYDGLEEYLRGKLAAAQAEEDRLSMERRIRARKGLPDCWDRRNERWVSRQDFIPVAFVD